MKQLLGQLKTITLTQLCGLYLSSLISFRHLSSLFTLNPVQIWSCDGEKYRKKVLLSMPEIPNTSETWAIVKEELEVMRSLVLLAVERLPSCAILLM